MRDLIRDVTYCAW